MLLACPRETALGWLEADGVEMCSGDLVWIASGGRGEEGVLGMIPGDLLWALGTWCLLRWRAWRRSRFRGGEGQRSRTWFWTCYFEWPVRLQMEMRRRLLSPLGSVLLVLPEGLPAGKGVLVRTDQVMLRNPCLSGVFLTSTALPAAPKVSSCSHFLSL